MRKMARRTLHPACMMHTSVQSMCQAADAVVRSYACANSEPGGSLQLAGLRQPPRRRQQPAHGWGVWGDIATQCRFERRSLIVGLR